MFFVSLFLTDHWPLCNSSFPIWECFIK